MSYKKLKAMAEQQEKWGRFSLHHFADDAAVVIRFNEDSATSLHIATVAESDTPDVSIAGSWHYFLDAYVDKFEVVYGLLYEELKAMAAEKKEWGDFLVTWVPLSDKVPNAHAQVQVRRDGWAIHLAFAFPSGYVEEPTDKKSAEYIDWLRFKLEWLRDE